MSPLSAWTSVVIGGALYHGAKHLLGIGGTDWGDYASSIWWLGIAALAVHFKWVTP